MSTFYHNKFSGHLKHQNITDGFLKKIQSQILVTWVHMLNSLTIFNSTFTSGLHAYIYLLALIAAETFNFENEREWPFHQKLLTLFYGSKLQLPLNLISLDFVTVWLLKSILLFRENPWYANVLFFFSENSDMLIVVCPARGLLCHMVRMCLISRCRPCDMC